MKIIAAVLFFGLLAMATPASACQFDTDCQVGSRCKKSSGSLYGFCVGGQNPGNNNDRVPAYDPLDPSRGRGETCQYDVDCGPGNACRKASGALYGVCLKR